MQIWGSTGILKNHRPGQIAIPVTGIRPSQVTGPAQVSLKWFQVSPRRSLTREFPSGCPFILVSPATIQTYFCLPIAPICAHFGSVLIPGKPGLYQPFPDEFTSVSIEFCTYSGFVSDTPHKNRFIRALFGKRSQIYKMTGYGVIHVRKDVFSDGEKAALNTGIRISWFRGTSRFPDWCVAGRG